MQTMTLLHVCGALIYLFIGIQTAIAGKCDPFQTNANYCPDTSNPEAEPSNSSACRNSLKQVACSHDGITQEILAQNLYCFATDGSSLSDQEGFVRLMSDIPLNILADGIDNFCAMISGEESFNSDAQHVIFTAYWERVKSEASVMQDGALMRTYFQQRPHCLLNGVTANQLNCMTNSQLQCDSFEAIVEALDDFFCKSDNEKNKEIADWIGYTLSLLECTKPTLIEWILTFWKSFYSYVNFLTLLKIRPDFDGSQVLHLLTADQLASYTISSGVCGGTHASDVDTCERIINILKQNDKDFFFNFMTTFSTTATPQLQQQVNFTNANQLLQISMDKLTSDSSDVCSSTFKTLFQLVSHVLLWALDTKSLAMLPKPTDCSSFQAIYTEIDQRYTSSDAETTQVIFQQRLSFLKDQKNNNGDACTYLSTGCRHWLIIIAGGTLDHFTFDDLKYLNPSCIWINAVDILTSTQLADLTLEYLILVNLKTEEEKYEVQQNVKVIMNTLTNLETTFSGSVHQYAHEFSHRVKQTGFVTIVNMKVCTTIWSVIFTYESKIFNTFTDEDWKWLFEELLPIFSLCITQSQLNSIKIPNCEILQNATHGLCRSYNSMTKDVQDNTAQWITTTLKKQDCSTNNFDWILTRYQCFSRNLVISTITEINPDTDLYNVMEYLDITQIALLALSTGALTDMPKAEEIMNELQRRNSINDILAFWDTISNQTKSPATDRQVSAYLLITILKQQKDVLSSGNVTQIYLFLEALKPVLPAINSTIFQNINSNISCQVLIVIVQVLNECFIFMEEPNRKDVAIFIREVLTIRKEDGTFPEDSSCSSSLTYTVWLKKILGLFSVYFNFDIIQYYRGGTGNYLEILKLLTPEQTGEMMATQDILESKPAITNVLTYISNQPEEVVTKIMLSFTFTVTENNVQINPTVAQDIITTYLSIKESTLYSVNLIKVAEVFSNISVLVQYTDDTVLQRLNPTDCSHLAAIVSGLNIGYKQMTAESRMAGVNWISDSLTKLKGCPMASTENWCRELTGSFLPDFKITTIKVLNKQFDNYQVLQNLTTVQLAETLVTSGGLKNVDQTNAILENFFKKGPELSDILNFLDNAKANLDKQTIQVIKSEEVRNAVVSTILSNVANFYNELDETTYCHLFSDSLVPFLASIDGQELDKIPSDISCTSFQCVIAALNKVTSPFTHERKQAIYHFSKRILDSKIEDTGKACTDNIIDSNDYVNKNFGPGFSVTAISECSYYYHVFDAIQVLDKQSAQQLAQTTIEMNAYNNVLLSARILSEVNTMPSDQKEIYYNELSELTKEAKVTIEDKTVQNLLWNNGIKTYQEAFTSGNSTQIEEFFNVATTTISAIQNKDVNIILSNTNCDGVETVVKALSNQYDQLSADQHNFISQEIITHLKKIAESEGSPCDTENTTSQEWSSSYINVFIKHVNVSLVFQLKPDLSTIDIVMSLSSEQKADALIKENALQDKDTFLRILVTITNTEQLNAFLMELNAKSPDDLKQCYFGGDILYKATEILAKEITTLPIQTVSNIINDRFQNIIQNANKTILKLIPQSVSCEIYKTVIQAVSLRSNEMLSQDQNGISEFCYEFLSSKVTKKSTVACGSTSDDTRTWMKENINVYSLYMLTEQFYQLNQMFDGYEVLDLLTAIQIADMVILTNTLNDEDKICKVMSRVLKMDISQIYEFLGRLNSNIIKNRSTVSANIRKKILLSVVNSLEAAFSLYDADKWTALLQKLSFCLSSMDAEVLNKFPLVTCDSFQAIVGQLSNASSLMTPESMNDIYQFCNNFLLQQFQLTGSACRGNSESSMEWKATKFAAFGRLLTSDDTRKMFPGFNWLEILEELNTNQLADVTVTYVIHGDSESVKTLTNSLSKRSAEDGMLFLTTISGFLQKQNIKRVSAPINTIILECLLPLIQSTLPSLDETQWAVLMTPLSYFIGGMTIELMKNIPSNLPCVPMQNLVSVLSQSSANMSPDIRLAISSFIKGSLINNRNVNGSPCTDNTKNDSEWLQKNCGSFNYLFSYADLQDIRPNFNGLNALGVLSPVQSAQLCFASDALENKNTMLMIMAGLDEKTIGDFMAEFTAIVTNKGLSLQNTDVMKAMFAEIVCILKITIRSALSNNCKYVFEKMLFILLPYMDSSHLTSFPDLTCDCLTTFINAVTSASGSAVSPDVCTFIINNLKSQAKSKGSACTSSVSDDSQWMNTYLGPCQNGVKYSELIVLKPNFKGSTVINQMSSSQMVQYVVESKSSVSVVSSALLHVENSEDSIGALQSFLIDLQSNNQQLNAKANFAIAQKTFSMLSSSFSDMDTATFTGWIVNLGGSLCSLNGTILEFLPLDLSCENYQAFVSALNPCYSQMTPVKQKQIYQFMVSFLINKHTTEGSACGEDNLAIKDWAKKNLGAHCKQIQPTDFAEISLDFSSVSLPDDCPSVC